MPNIDWLWLGIGILVAMFVIPFVRAKLAK
jgi:hypothetical protein